MYDELSYIEAYTPVKIEDGRVKRDNKIILFSKDLGFGGTTYYSYDSVNCTFKEVRSIMNYMAKNGITKLGKLNADRKKKYLMMVDRTLRDVDSVRTFKMMLSKMPTRSL